MELFSVCVLTRVHLVRGEWESGVKCAVGQLFVATGHDMWSYVVYVY